MSGISAKQGDGPLNEWDIGKADEKLLDEWVIGKVRSSEQTEYRHEAYEILIKRDTGEEDRLGRSEAARNAAFEKSDKNRYRGQV